MRGERFAIDDVAAHDLPDGTVVARNRRTGAQMSLPGEVFNAISHCDSFRTMEGHIEHLAGPQAKGREGEIQRILQSVMDGGLMLSAGKIAERLEPQEGGPVEESPVAAIITSERPKALSRLLESMLGHCDLGRVERLVVVDDSRSEEALSANREAIEATNRALESRGLKRIRHFTPDDARNFARALVERLPDQEAGIRFLLDREGREREVSTGIARNFAELHAVGRPLLVFDDDVLCQVMNPPETERGVEFSARRRGCRFYASDKDWQSLRTDEDECPVRRHMQVLGSTLGVSLYTLGRGRPTTSAFEHASPGFAGRLEPDHRILITQCGSYGDPGSGGNEWIALLPAETRAQLASLTEDFESAMEHRNCWLGRSRPVFEPRANMSQLTGIDNRGYMPPYFPVFRGQDRTYGAMTEFLHPDSLAADLPFALPHLPIPRRSWRDSHRGFSLPFTLTHFLNLYLAGQVRNCGARDVMNRNEWLATLYHDLADSTRDRIVEITAGQWTQRRIEWLTRLERALDESSGGPAPLTNLLRSAMRQLQSSGVPDLHGVKFDGPPAGLEGDEVLDYWRTAWHDFAAGLRAWPKVRMAAAEALR